MTSAEELLAGLRPSRQATWRALRGKLWLDHAIWRSGLTPRQFESEHIHRDRSPSNLMGKWLAGDVLPSHASAKALERRIPGTLWVFELPLFPLLANFPVLRQDLRRLTADWEAREEMPGMGPDWRLPPDSEGRTVCYLCDTSSLVSRGDLWGLTALTAIMRLAELEGDQPGHVAASKDAFRALPALMRLQWFGPSAHAIFQQLEALQHRMPYSKVSFQADWATLKVLSKLANYEPDPLKRMSGSTSPYELYPDPIVLLRHIPAAKISRW